jgi:hypothetical protein
MQMEHSEFLEIQEQLEDHFNNVYVRVEDCKNTVNSEKGKIDELKEEFSKLREEVRVDRAKTNTRLSILIAILSAIAVPILGVCIKLLFGY